jgi:hypothetical protein
MRADYLPDLMDHQDAVFRRVPLSCSYSSRPALIRWIDELHLDRPFAGAQMAPLFPCVTLHLWELNAYESRTPPSI